MVNKKTKKASQITKSDCFPLIEKALHKRTKAELVAMVLAIARGHDVVARELEERLDIKKPMDQVIADVLSAINRATWFDERMVNQNFDVDWKAYDEVRKGLSLLVDQGHLWDAKWLALMLIKAGSLQVECSDDGLMTDDICQCLLPVIRAVKAVGGAEAIQWASEMQKADNVGCICDKELAELRGGS